jgi:spore coat protein U-like protein
MTAFRSLCIAIVALVLIAGRPAARAEDQYPHGLMSAAPTTSDNRVCTIDVSPVSFGNYDPLSGAAVDALGSVTYVCGNGGASTNAKPEKAVRVELETGSGNTYSPRSMTNGTGVDHLDYNLYLDPTHRTIWGNGFAGTDVYIDDHPPNRTPVTVPIFGRIFPLQDLPAGQYVDALVARVVF